MSLSPIRAAAYAAGALAGAFGALTVIAARERRPATAAKTLALALCCGALSVLAEETAQSRE